MVDNLFDNKYALTYEQTFNLLSKLFSINFDKSNELIESINYGMAFKIEYLLLDYTFIFQSERGYIEGYSIKQNNLAFNLRDYEPLLKNIEVTSEKNVNFLITVLKRFIAEQKNNESLI